MAYDPTPHDVTYQWTDGCQMTHESTPRDVQNQWTDG